MSGKITQEYVKFFMYKIAYIRCFHYLGKLSYYVCEKSPTIYNHSHPYSMSNHVKKDRSGLNYDSLFITALGVGVALSWNTAIKETILYTYPSKSSNSVLAHFKYAMAVTIVAIIVLFIAKQVETVVRITQPIREGYKTKIEKNVCSIIRSGD